MQQRVKEKQPIEGIRISSVILKILVLLIVSLVVSCSFSGICHEAPSHELSAGDYFGGTSSGFWSPKNYVPPEIEFKSSRLSKEIAE